MRTAAAGIDTLLAFWTSAGLKPVDGPPGTRTLPRGAVLFVGVTAADVSGATTTRVNEGLGLRAHDTTTIRCVVSCSRGDGLMSPTRSAALDLAELAAGFVEADSSLGGVVALAEVGDSQLMQHQTPEGAVADVIFDVIVQGLG